MEIDVLTDPQAIRALALLADHNGVQLDPAQLRELDQRLREATDDPELTSYTTPGSVPVASASPDGASSDAASPDGAVSDGELARATLAHLASTPEHAENVRRAVSIAATDTSRFLDPATLAIGGLVLVALQTEIELTRTSTGRWRLRIHKTAISDSTLGKVLSALVGRFRRTPA